MRYAEKEKDYSKSRISDDNTFLDRGVAIYLIGIKSYGLLVLVVIFRPQ